MKIVPSYHHLYLMNIPLRFTELTPDRSGLWILDSDLLHAFRRSGLISYVTSQLNILMCLFGGYPQTHSSSPDSVAGMCLSQLDRLCLSSSNNINDASFASIIEGQRRWQTRAGIYGKAYLYSSAAEWRWRKRNWLPISKILRQGSSLWVWI